MSSQWDSAIKTTKLDYFFKHKTTIGKLVCSTYWKRTSEIRIGK